MRFTQHLANNKGLIYGTCRFEAWIILVGGEDIET